MIGTRTEIAKAFGIKSNHMNGFIRCLEKVGGIKVVDTVKTGRVGAPVKVYQIKKRIDSDKFRVEGTGQQIAAVLGVSYVEVNGLLAYLKATGQIKLTRKLPDRDGLQSNVKVFRINKRVSFAP
jgi:transcription initiation factor IIE alpha subunit